MTAPIRTSWRALLPVVLLLAACGGQTASPTGSTAAAASASGAPGDGSPTAPGGSLAPGAISLDLAVRDAVPAAESENAVRADGRTGADLAGYLGPDAPAVAAAMDRQASDELWKLVDGAATAGVDGLLASVRLPQLAPPNDAAVPPPGMSLLGPWAASMIAVEETVGSDRAYTKSSHEDSDASSAAGKGTITTDSTVSVTPSGSRLVVDVDLRTSGDVKDGAGHLVFRISGTGHAHVEIQGCPDAAGVALADVEFTADEDYFAAADGGRAGSSWKEDDQAHARIFADDNADLDRAEFDLNADRAIKGGTRASGAGQTDLTAFTVDASEPVTIRRDGSGTTGSRTTAAPDAPQAEVDRTYHLAEQILSLAVHTSAKAAEKFWRSGKCIEVVVDPKGGDVGADSKTTVTAKVRHKFDKDELDKPVEATMTGAKSVDPVGKKLPAPATFTYTAGPKPGDAGDVTFKSVSNRGIGQTTVHFKVGEGWEIVAGNNTSQQSVKGQKCGGLDGLWRIDGRAVGSGTKTVTTWKATIDGTTLRGTYTLKSVGTLTTAYGNIVTTATGTGPATLVAQEAGSYLMTLAAISTKSTAVGAGTTQTISIPMPSITFTWSPGGTCPP